MMKEKKLFIAKHSSSSGWTELALFSFITPTQPPGKVVKLEI
jgi:hypothetical protein